MRYKILKGKKAQEEILGFVLIILLVIVGGVIFLAITLNKPVEEQQSLEAENLLQTVLSYTTNCAIQFEPQYDSIQDLIGDCYSGFSCSNLGANSCEVLNSSLNSILTASLGNVEILKTSKITAYTFEIKAEDNSSISSIPVIFSGNCTNKLEYGASQPIETNSGKLNIFLKLCYS